MHELKAGPNVVVSLTRAETRSQGYAYDRIPGRLGLMLGMLSPTALRVKAAPTAAETIIRSMMVGRTHQLDDLRSGDWLISLPLPFELGFMNWKDAFSLIGSAEAHTTNQLEALSQSDAGLHRQLFAATDHAQAT